MSSKVLLAVAALGPPGLYMLTAGAKNINMPNMGVAVVILLGGTFFVLTLYSGLATSPTARGPKRGREWAALTAAGVKFVRDVYAKTASVERTHRLSIEAVRKIFETTGSPIGGPLFFTNNRNKGTLTEAEWVLRWHMAFALQPKESTVVLEKLLLERGVAGDRFTCMVVQSKDPQTTKPAAVPVQILVFGSKGCGKTALINSFIEGRRHLSTATVPHKEASHNVVETVEIEDGDLGGGGEGHNQVLLLREMPCALEDIPSHVDALRAAGIFTAASLALILYSPFDDDSEEYAEAMHKQVSSAGLAHMFIRTKHDLHIAAYGEEDKAYLDDMKYYEPPGKCDDCVTEVVSVKEMMYGEEEEDILFLHQQVGWAGLNRQMFTCRNGGVPSKSWLSFFTVTRVIMLGLAMYILVQEGPQLWAFLQEWEHTRPFLAPRASLEEEFASL